MRSNRRCGSPSSTVRRGLPVFRSMRSMRANEAASVSNTASAWAWVETAKGSSMKPFSAFMVKTARAAGPPGTGGGGASPGAWGAQGQRRGILTDLPALGAQIGDRAAHPGGVGARVARLAVALRDVGARALQAGHAKAAGATGDVPPAAEIGEALAGAIGAP